MSKLKGFFDKFRKKDKKTDISDAASTPAAEESKGKTADEGACRSEDVALYDEAETATLREEFGVPAKNELSVMDDLSAKKKKGKKKDVAVSGISELAALLDEDEKKVRDDCLFSGVKKFTAKLGKVIVRYDVSDEELIKLAINSQTLGLKETAVSPAYIPAVARAVKRSKENMTVSSLVDFPFGENAFSAKIAGVRESVSAGVDEVTVFMPAMCLYKENKKQLAKDLKRLAKSYKNHAGVAFSAENLSEENILNAARAAEKAKLSHILFAFGECSEEDIKRKLAAVPKSGARLTLKVLGNVRTAGGAAKLFKMGAELVLTPFADEIGDELLKQFGIKSVKLI